MVSVDTRHRGSRSPAVVPDGVVGIWLISAFAVDISCGVKKQGSGKMKMTVSPKQGLVGIFVFKFFKILKNIFKTVC